MSKDHWNPCKDQFQENKPVPESLAAAARWVCDPFIGWIEVFPKGFRKHLLESGSLSFSIRFFSPPSIDSVGLMRKIIENLVVWRSQAVAAVEPPGDDFGNLLFDKESLKINNIVIKKDKPLRLSFVMESSFSEDCGLYAEILMEERDGAMFVDYSTWSS